MAFNKDEVKDNLDDDNVFELLEFLGAEPRDTGGAIICRTICHGGDSHKLYYYKEQRLFKCYTNCDEAFDIFELIVKLKEVDLNQAVGFIVNYFNLQWRLEEFDNDYSAEDWKVFSRWNKNNEIKINHDLVEYPEYSLDIIKNYPQPRYLNWEKEGINKEVCDYMDIHYNPLNGSIIIPHFDQDGRMIGIRERTLVQENEQYGKYRPAKINNKMYNHPLAFNLYGLDKAKDNIAAMQTAIVVESEKAVMQYISYFGLANNICVAVCGNSLSKYQFQLLKQAGAKEIVIGFDKDFEQACDEDWYRVVNKLQKIYDKYGQDLNLSFLFDKDNVLLGYKDSPLDKGPAAFLELFRNRVIL